MISAKAYIGATLPPTTGHAQMLISMCMDHRKDLALPGEFAYVLRSAGGNLRDSEFEVSYAIGVGGVSTVALLAHTDCGMAHVTQMRSAFIRGLTKRCGWSLNAAGAHFDRYVERYQMCARRRCACSGSILWHSSYRCCAMSRRTGSYRSRSRRLLHDFNISA